MTNHESAEPIAPPGERLREMLDEREWTQGDLSAILGGDPKAVNEIVCGRRAITPQTAKGLAAAFNTTAAYWLELENAYRLSLVARDDGLIAKRAKLFERAPIREMERRGWIQPTKEADELERRVLAFFGMKSLDDEPQVWAHAARKSASYSKVTPAQHAWLARARQLAMAAPTRNFTESRFEEGLERLKGALHHKQEVRNVSSILADAGIRLVIVEPLSGTKIDGVCFWLNSKSPAIALSLRYDRIDSFWYTLLHEIGHIRAKDGLREKACPVDVGLADGSDQGTEEKPQSEKDADLFAAAFEIDPSQLQDFIVRVGPLYSRKRILGFANRLKVHPGIVIGQLQNRGEISYAHSRNMLEKIRGLVTDVTLTDGWGFAPNIIADTTA